MTLGYKENAAVTNEQPKQRRGSPWPETIAVTLSVLAVLISGYAVVLGNRQFSEQRDSELINAIYEDWDMLSDPAYWEASHLVEAPATYEQQRDILRAYTAGLSAQEKRKVYLQERAFAGRILTMWENHLNQWRIAAQSGDEMRMRLLQTELDFYAHEQLRNPRLLWLFLPEGGNLMQWLDPENIVYYREHVLADPKRPLEQEPDAEGILPGFDPLASDG
ncbi:MAG: hypothetical protein PVF89_01750 [Lysobacterales bacterium]